MSHSSPNNGVEESTAPSPPLTESLVTSSNHLSINAASSKPLPSSSQPSSPARTLGRQNSVTASPNGKIPPRSPLHRSPSSMSLDRRSSTPSLHRKASMKSLQGIGGVAPSRSPTRASPSRRSSSASFLNASTMIGKSPLSEIEDVVETRPRHTAVSIACNHFKVELESHNKEEETRPTDTIVILHDSCYGHRYSRPRTSKSALATIVERPERIHASILGLSVAYVRLGERHAEGQYPLHPHKDPDAIPTIPFRIRKTTRRLALSSQAVTNVHGVKWMEELKIMCDNAESKLAINGKELTRPEISRSPDQGTSAKLHEGDLYLCSESLNAMEGALGAVCEGVDAVFQGSTNGKGPHRTFVAIRPPGHHCSASYPSGFCWLNNVHVGISHAALTHGLTHAAIIDFDLHHGDGSQAMAWEHNRRATNLPKNALPWKKTSIGYFSLHDINSYPCEMGDEEKVKNASLCIENAHGQSIWNVHLQPWKSENEFWDLYETKYSVLLDKTRNYLRTQTERLRAIPNGPKPRAAIFLSAGFDASEWESSGMQRHKVNVPTDFYARLTRDVVRLAAEEGSGVEGRIISVLEGGYSDRALCSGVFSHLSGLAGGDPIAIKREYNHNGLGYEMGQKIGAYNGVDSSSALSTTSNSHPYDPAWWSLPLLEQLDATVHPPPPPPGPKKPKDGAPPTYSSPTQSFIAKVTSPRVQRSVSNMSNASAGSPRSVIRAPSPPPPEVEWTVAAHELSKLLIPGDRQTMSCRPEDLSAEATRARRDRQSILTPPTSTSGSEPPESAPPRMALRVRKPAKAPIETVDEDEAKRPVAKANRRKTVAGAALIAAEKATVRSTTPKPEPSYIQPTSQSSRRLSVASNSGSGISEGPTSRPNGHNRLPSNGTTMSARPVTSQSARPDSSMSSRGHSIPPVVVKKTRAPAKSREPSKASQTHRKSPPNESRAQSEEQHAPILPPSRSSSVLPLIETSTSQNSDVDNLTSGMKKIKLNLTTKAQRDAREQAKAAINAPLLKGPPKTSSQKATQPVSNEHPTNDNLGNRMNSVQEPLTPPLLEAASLPEVRPLEIDIPISPTTLARPPSEAPFQIEEATRLPLPASPPVPPSFTQSAVPQTAAGADVFVPYQPEGPPPNSMQQQEPIRWLPPNTATPTPMKRGDLPVFTATSTIPFGLPAKSSPDGATVPKPNENSNSAKDPEKYDHSIWEVPETPHKK